MAWVLLGLAVAIVLLAIYMMKGQKTGSSNVMTTDEILKAYADKKPAKQALVRPDPPLIKLPQKTTQQLLDERGYVSNLPPEDQNHAEKANDAAVFIGSRAVSVPNADPYPEKDAWETVDYYSGDALPAFGAYRISYVDRQGLATTREIEARRVVDAEGDRAILAFCRMRGSTRTFFDKRIKSAVFIETGEVIESVAQHAVRQYEVSDIGRVMQALNRDWADISILLYVCRADGRMLAPERKIVAEYVIQNCSDLHLNPDLLDQEIKKLYEPDNRSFKQAVKEIKAAGDKQRLEKLLQFSTRIVDTQKTVTPFERAAIEMLTDAVKAF